MFFVFFVTSKYLDDAGVISGNDITREAAIAKLMFLLGNEPDIEQVKRKLAVPLTGEMAVL
jgi:L-asparaginase